MFHAPFVRRSIRESPELSLFSAAKMSIRVYTSRPLKIPSNPKGWFRTLRWRCRLRRNVLLTTQSLSLRAAGADMHAMKEDGQVRLCSVAIQRSDGRETVAFGFNLVLVLHRAGSKNTSGFRARLALDRSFLQLRRSALLLLGALTKGRQRRL